MGLRHRTLAGPRRAVSSGVDPDRRGPADAAEFSRERTGLTMFPPLIEKLMRREDLTERGSGGGDGRGHGGPRAPSADRRPADRPGDEGRAAGRDRRPGADDARACGAAVAAATTACSTPAAPAAIAPARSTSRRARRSSSPPAACRSPSTATGRCRACRAAPTCSRRSACDVTAPPAVVERCLDEAGIGFFFAPTFHPSMRHAAPARRALGVRTAFNLLGPLTNPAGRDAPARRRAAAGVHRAARAGAAAARLRARLGGARRRRHRRDLDDRLHEDLRVPRRRGEHVLSASGRRRACRRRAAASLQGGDADGERADHRRACSPASAGRRATSCC